MKQIFRSIRGTTDFYPPQSFVIEEIIEKVKAIFQNFGYEPIILPHLEEEGLFKKSVGTITDIVEKQMFKIESKDIVLRPEGTAQVARFYIENNLSKLRDFHKFYYLGAMFRGERPQKGRLREFNHIGAEAIGSNSFYLDAEIIELAVKIVREIGIKDFSLKLNSLGCIKDKNRLAQLIKDKLAVYKNTFCPDCQKRFNYNPLRILDCKNEGCRVIIHSLNLDRTNYLCSDCNEHFSGVLNLLDEFAIAYHYDPLLVRGLDYYTNTVFEIITSLLGSQDALGAGGRYNELISNLGGDRVGAVGFALGLERILLLLDTPTQINRLEVFVASSSLEMYKEAYRIARLLRENNIPSEIDYKDRTLKAQLKYANKLGIPIVIIVGDEEFKEGYILVRDMEKSLQEKVRKEDLLSIIKRRKRC
ncbi:MAG: histidine--tRNA ligase [Candidatus Omnitrophica bacterium]|nr:histidine--tRNA ligase [Candidatus Omnitrophota bacterium]